MTATDANPNAEAKGWKGFRTYLEMIKIEHSVFALPFAMIGMMWAAAGWPGLWVFFWIVVAMVSCRSAAMAFNRIVDRDIDAINPRTRVRAIPAGLLSLRTANLYFLGSCAIFVLAAAMLNWVALALSPLALGITLLYSLTKRFTTLCHFVLGLSLGIAPVAAYIAVTGSLDGLAPYLWLMGAVTFWTAGFDILYSLQDEEFDRANRLRSLPQTLGKSRALAVSRICHGLTVAFLLMAGFSYGAGVFWVIGVVLVGLLLAWEQSLVKPNDLSRIDLAFFTLNGFVSIGLFVFALIDVLVRNR
ncbi:MAG: UbiA-like polyprenyltransferase [Fimbriimonadaceae bacterium]